MMPSWAQTETKTRTDLDTAIKNMLQVYYRDSLGNNHTIHL